MKVNLDRPDKSEMELNESQNFLNSSKSQKNLITYSYLLYTITFIPSLFSILLVKYNKDFKKFIKDEDYLLIACFAIILVIGLSLAFSKILSRKYPFNYLIYFFYCFCLSFLFAGIAEEFSKKKSLFFIIFMIAQGFTCFLYSLISKNFLFKHCIIFVFSILLFVDLFLCVIYDDYVVFIVSMSFMVFFISSFIIFAMECLAQNKNFLLLPDDYIMACMKMSMVLPMLAEIFN